MTLKSIIFLSQKLDHTLLQFQNKSKAWVPLLGLKKYEFYKTKTQIFKQEKTVGLVYTKNNFIKVPVDKFLG